MRFWLSKNSEISLREQLSRQIVLAIVSGDLRPNEQLPSVREMALRHDVHPNTVSAAYVWLQERDWIESRKGSGVFVKEKSAGEIENAAQNTQNELDFLISNFLNAARMRGFSPFQVAARLQKRIEKNEFAEILLVEQDEELRRILAFEISSAVSFPVREIGLENFVAKCGALVVALEETAKQLPPDVPKIALRLNSAQNEMRGKQRPAKHELIGIASRWETFLRWSATMLVAVGISNEQIILRDAKQKDWQRGLQNCAFVIADSLTAQELSESARVRVFRLIAGDSLRELKTFTE